MMLDDDVVAVSPATVYRVLRAAGRLDRHPAKPTKKGTGFVQPLGPHMHWHIDIAVITIAGMYYYLCSVLDGHSRSIVQWDFLDRMTEADVELILQRAREAHSEARPRITGKPTRTSSPGCTKRASSRRFPRTRLVVPRSSCSPTAHLWSAGSTTAAGASRSATFMSRRPHCAGDSA